jgi:hypothetical protein
VERLQSGTDTMKGKVRPFMLRSPASPFRAQSFPGDDKAKFLSQSSLLLLKSFS